MIADAQQIVGRERRERVSQLAWCGGGCFDSRRRVNSTVSWLHSRFHIMIWVSHVLILALLLLVTPNVESSGSPQNKAPSRCGQTAAEQNPLLREAIDNRYTLRRIEFIGNETISDHVLRRRVVLREGDYFSQRNLVKTLASLNKLKQLYPL